MELRLKYGKGMVQAEFKPPRQFAELHPRHIATLQKPADILSQVLDKPLGCHPFDQIFRCARNVLLVVPEPSQHSGAEHYLPLLFERLLRLRVPEGEIAILVANGAEAPQSPHRESNFTALLGCNARVWWHDPSDHRSLEYVGMTRRSTPVFINRLILDADEVIICGAVMHHPFAGFGGGPRLIVPGCAGQETIKRHLALAIRPEAPGLNPRCRDAVIEANPLQEDAREAFRFVTASFLVHAVLNAHQHMIGAVAGEPLQAYAAGCRTIGDVFQTPIDHFANLVIVSCGGYPGDIDYRTAHIALHHAVQALRPGSVVIFLAECPQGLGSSQLLNWFRDEASPIAAKKTTSFGAESPDWRGFSHHLLPNDDPDDLIALSTIQKARENRIIAVTGLEPALVRRLGFTPAESFREALQIAASWLPDIFSAYVIPNGTLLVPLLSEV
jgi:nickel-dependent lactate racemase